MQTILEMKIIQEKGWKLANIGDKESVSFEIIIVDFFIPKRNSASLDNSVNEDKIVDLIIHKFMKKENANGEITVWIDIVDMNIRTDKHQELRMKDHGEGGNSLKIREGKTVLVLQDIFLQVGKEELNSISKDSMISLTRETDKQATCPQPLSFNILHMYIMLAHR